MPSAHLRHATQHHQEQQQDLTAFRQRGHTGTIDTTGKARAIGVRGDSDGRHVIFTIQSVCLGQRDRVASNNGSGELIAMCRGVA